MTDGSAVVSTTLQFNNCTAGGGSLPLPMTCKPSDLAIGSVSAPGSALGVLTLGQNNCTITVSNGLCVIRTSNTGGGQSVALNATGATGSGPAQLTAGVSGNTDAVTFNASGPFCGLLGIPASGTWTVSNAPNSGVLVYDEVGSGLDIS